MNPRRTSAPRVARAAASMNRLSYYSLSPEHETVTLQDLDRPRNAEKPHSNSRAAQWAFEQSQQVFSGEQLSDPFYDYGQPDPCYHNNQSNTWANMDGRETIHRFLDDERALLTRSQQATSGRESFRRFLGRRAARDPILQVLSAASEDGNTSMRKSCQATPGREPFPRFSEDENTTLKQSHHSTPTLLNEEQLAKERAQLELEKQQLEDDIAKLEAEQGIKIPRLPPLPPIEETHPLRPRLLNSPISRFRSYSSQRYAPHPRRASNTNSYSTLRDHEVPFVEAFGRPTSIGGATGTTQHSDGRLGVNSAGYPVPSRDPFYHEMNYTASSSTYYPSPQELARHNREMARAEVGIWQGRNLGRHDEREEAKKVDDEDEAGKLDSAAAKADQ